MKDYVSIICGGSILLILILGIIYAKLYERAEKKGTEISKICDNIFIGFFVILILCFLASGSSCAATWIVKTFSEPKVQAIIIIDHSGGVIAEYENDSDDLSYTYSNGKVEITSGDEQYIYLNVTAIIVNETNEERR